jgi:hypothetical protein
MVRKTPDSLSRSNQKEMNGTYRAAANTLEHEHDKVRDP